MPNYQQIFGHNAVFSGVTLRSVMLEFSKSTSDPNFPSVHIG